MANIMDLFTSSEVTETKFDLAQIKTAAERIVKMQKRVGGRPKLMAKVGAGGVKIFTVSNGNRDVVVEKLRGVIIAEHRCNALFPPKTDDDTSANTPPICSSVDGESGIVLETGECRDCETCPHNVFGTAGKGKACKNMHRLYILTEEAPIPITLTLPPTSLDLWRNYATMDVAAAGLELNEVMTEFGLTNAVSSKGDKYSIVNFKLIGLVNEEVRDFCENMSKSIEASPRPEIAAEEYNREELSEGAVIAQNEPDDIPPIAYEDSDSMNIPDPAEDELPDWSSDPDTPSGSGAVIDFDDI